MDALHTLSNIISGRRSIKPAKMNGGKIPDELVSQILSLADWAPTHAYTEPWRFRVYCDEAVKDFCRKHAELYKQHTPAEKYLQTTYYKLLTNGDQASHLVIAIMQRGHLPRIPVLEEIAATSAAMQNILLGATAAGLASFWSTGGMTHSPELRQQLGLFEQDLVLGMLYLGYTDEQPEGRRNIPFEHKLMWIK